MNPVRPNSRPTDLLASDSLLPIDRRAFIGVSAATAALLATNPLGLLARTASRQSNFVEVRGGVGVFNGQGGTIGWFIGPDGAVIIDSQFPRTAEPCRKGLLERSEKGLSMLINTHHHGDHTGGNGVFKSTEGGDGVEKIVAHENVPALQKAQATERGTLEGQVYADTTFAKTWKQKLGDETVHAKYYGPAHTGGDAVIHFAEANVAHVGDLVFNRAHPFIDFPGGGTIIGWIDVLQKVHDDFDDETYVIFGHGQQAHGVVGRRKDVLLMKDYFERALDHVSKGIAKGATKDEIIASEPQGFDQYVSFNERMSLAATLERCYEDLERTKGGAGGGKKEKPSSRPKG